MCFKNIVHKIIFNIIYNSQIIMLPNGGESTSQLGAMHACMKTAQLGASGSCCRSYPRLPFLDSEAGSLCHDVTSQRSCQTRTQRCIDDQYDNRTNSLFLNATKTDTFISREQSSHDYSPVIILWLFSILFKQ